MSQAPPLTDFQPDNRPYARNRTRRPATTHISASEAFHRGFFGGFGFLCAAILFGPLLTIAGFICWLLLAAVAQIS